MPRKKIKRRGKRIYVYFDLESNFGYKPGNMNCIMMANSHNILSISACCGDSTFDVMCRQPNTYIPRHSTCAYHGICQLQSVRNALYTGDAIRRFIAFVESLQKKYKSTNVILAAHNATFFDITLLLKEAAASRVRIPYHWRYFDTLLAARRMLKNMSSYKLGDLYHYFTGEKLLNAHTSLADCVALQVIGKKLNVRNTDIKEMHDYLFVPDTNPVRDIRYIGPRTEKILNDMGIQTCRDLRTLENAPEVLRQFVKNDIHFFNIMIQVMQMHPLQLASTFHRLPQTSLDDIVNTSTRKKLKVNGITNRSDLEELYFFKCHEDLNAFMHKLISFGIKPQTGVYLMQVAIN